MPNYSCSESLSNWVFGCFGRALQFRKYYVLDVLLLGFRNSGKTSFVKALSGKPIDIDTVPTLHTRVSSITMGSGALTSKGSMGSLEIEERRQSASDISFNSSDQRSVPSTIEIRSLVQAPSLVLKVHDLSGQYCDHPLWKNYLVSNRKRFNTILYFVNVSDPLTLDKSITTLRELLIFNNSGSKIPFAAVFNKLDLVDDLQDVINDSEQRIRSGGTNIVLSCEGNSYGGKGYNSNGEIKDYKWRAKSPTKGREVSRRRLLRYMGIFKDDNGEMYIKDTKSGKHMKLQTDVTIFLLSLKDEGKGKSFLKSRDGIKEIIDWMVSESRDNFTK